MLLVHLEEVHCGQMKSSPPRINTDSDYYERRVHYDIYQLILKELVQCCDITII